MSKTCARINKCITFVLILLSAIWFLFVIIINNRAEDPRIQSSNLLTGMTDVPNSKAGNIFTNSPIDSDSDEKIDAVDSLSFNTGNTFENGIYLRKIHLPEQYIDSDQIKQYPLQKFQLIEIMNDQTPNIVDNEIILIISITNQKLDLSSIKFSEYLYKNIPENDENKKIPPIIYILRQKTPVFLTGQKYLNSYREEISETLNYFVNILNIKKLSILSFQIGALLTLYTMALQSNLEIFRNIQKVVLINPFNPQTKVFHSPPIQFVKNFKQTILQDEEKFKLFNELRLIIISTTRTIFPEHPQAQEFFTFTYKKNQRTSQPINAHKPHFQYKSVFDLLKQLALSFTEKKPQQLYRFNNTITISSRSMWNVFSFFDEPIYFFYEPFINLVSKFFLEDSRYNFSKDQILYYFHYKQTPEVKELTQKTKRKYITNCVDFYLESYSYQGDTFKEDCIRLLRKQMIYFENSTILLYSKERFEVYGQDFERLYPYESKISYMIYHIENLNSFRRLFVINRKSAEIHLKIAPVFTPLDNPIVSFETEDPGLHLKSSRNQLLNFNGFSQVSFQNFTNFQVIRTCQPANLIFPVHFAKMAKFGHGIMFNKQHHKNCYTEYDNYDFYPDWFMMNWNILRNVMVFTLFCTHVLDNNIKDRFFTQNFINVIIIYVSLQRAMLFEIFITLSSLCVFQIFLIILSKVPYWLRVPRSIVSKFLWIPIAFQIMSIYYKQSSPSSWKILMLLLGLTFHRKSIYITIIKLSFLIQWVKYDERSLKSILVLCAWSYISIPDHDETLLLNKSSGVVNNGQDDKKVSRSSQSSSSFGQNQVQLINKLKKTLTFRSVLDKIFLFAMCVCINEEGSVIDQTINVYVVMRVLLYIYRFF